MKVRNRGRTVKEFESVPVLSKLPRMGSGRSVPVEIGIFPEGRYEVIVEADRGDAIKEPNEGINKRVQDFQVWRPEYRSVTYGYR